MKLVIAEKPSVAMSLAAVLGATERKDGYLEGSGYLVSWCVGHLLELAQPEAYKEQYAKWRYEDLPILPENWKYEVPKDKKTQLALLCRLMKDKRVDSVVCATDAGREGELIFRLVYEYAGCKKPMERLWISSMEDAEQFAETCQRFYKIADVFHMKILHPGILFGIYITIAQDWMKLNNAEQALDILSQYTELAVSNIYPLHLHGDDFFDLLDEWLDSELVLRSFPPRDETLIRHSMTQALNENPVFLPLAKDSRFQMMVNRLKASEEEK